MAEVTMVEALNAALRDALTEDPTGWSTART